MTSDYAPSPFVREVLDWTLEKIQALPYETTTRWSFYAAMQQFGLGGKKSYKKFIAWTSRARKRYYGGWTPTTLIDDTRELAVRGGGYDDPEEWIRSFLDESCILSKWAIQTNILLVLYEAAAMQKQFDYYLRPLCVSSLPFKGDASIRPKWEVAKHLAQMKNLFPDKPVVVLYFGDLDPKGLDIPRSAMKDIYPWYLQQLDQKLRDKHGQLKLVDGNGDPNDGQELWKDSSDNFIFHRAGLSKIQVKRSRPKIPENPEKPGTYQWEALSDRQAKTLITDAVGWYWSESKIGEIRVREAEATVRAKVAFEKLVEDLNG